MTIAPIVRSVQVKAAPARAFDLFTSRMEHWWPKGKTIGKAPHVALVLEPRAGGRWFERDGNGNETHWGKVLAWEPPSRLLLGWQINSQWTYDPDFLTEVEVTFAPVAGGGTLVTLEHRDLERFGADAARHAERRGGWPGSPISPNTPTQIRKAGEPIMAEFIVHSVPGSPFGRAVLATLEEKAAPYRLAALAPGSNRSSEHLARHPFGRVPVLEHEGFMLYETQAILRYLDRVLAEPALTPADAKAAGRMDQVMNICDWYLFQGVNNVIGFQRIVAPRLMGKAPDEEAIAAAMPKAYTVFNELSRLLNGKTYFAGDHVTLADLLVAPHIDFMAATLEWQPLTAAAPNLISWLDRMNDRASMKATTWQRVAEIAKAA